VKLNKIKQNKPESTNVKIMNYLKHSILIISIFLLAETANSAEPKNIQVHAFNTLNLNPMIQIFGLPSLNNQLIGKEGAIEFELEQQVANFYSQTNYDNQATGQSESIQLDGETWRTSINASYVISQRSQVSLSIPYLRHSAGYLDSPIYNWHDTLGLPQGGRTKETNDNIDIHYQRNNETILSQQKTTSGIGDIRIKYGYSLPLYDREMIIQSEIKLPTGDIDYLTGSEGTDLSMGFMINDTKTLEAQNISFWYGGAASYLENTKSPLSENQNNTIVSGRAGLGWVVNESITLKTQVDAHSAVYSSDTPELGDPAVMLTLGGDIHFSPRYRLELSGVEDMMTDTSPDIIFTAKLTAHFE
jgi:uncharacterized protein DUF3187